MENIENIKRMSELLKSSAESLDKAVDALNNEDTEGAEAALGIFFMRMLEIKAFIDMG